MRQMVSIQRNGADENGDAPALLIVGHGSRDPRGAREFHDLVGLVRRRNPSLMVEGGFIELSSPPISECVNSLAENGTRGVAAVPLMLLAAGHAKDDIPATLKPAAERVVLSCSESVRVRASETKHSVSRPVIPAATIPTSVTTGPPRRRAEIPSSRATSSRTILSA